MGDTGIEVSALQTHKVNVPTTGYFGPMTRAVTCNTTSPATVRAVTANTSTYPRDLSFGFMGDDVVSLQTFLKSKGYLTLLRGTSKGFFGGRTRDALKKYQTSVNIPPSGTFGPFTRSAIQGQ